MHYHRHHKNIIILALLILNILPTTYAGDLKFSGVLETEIGGGKDFSETRSSDIVQATVELAIDAKISDWVSGHIGLLYEDDGDTPLNVDEAIIEISNPLLSKFSLKAGQQYLPFGFFETNMVSDPLTLEIGEIGESAIVFSYNGSFTFSFYLFNGDLTLVDEKESIEHMGINLGYIYETDDLLVDVGVGYINSLGDTDGLGGVISQDPANNPDILAGSAGKLQKYIPGIASHLLVKAGSITFIADHVFATEEFTSPELRIGAAKPSALNVELGFDASDVSTLAMGVQQTVDTQGMGLPEYRVLMAYSYAINSDTRIAFEYAKDNEFSTSDGGMGRTASAFTLQLAASF